MSLVLWVASVGAAWRVCLFVVVLSVGRSLLVKTAKKKKERKREIWKYIITDIVALHVGILSSMMIVVFVSGDYSAYYILGL